MLSIRPFPRLILLCGLLLTAAPATLQAQADARVSDRDAIRRAVAARLAERHSTSPIASESAPAVSPVAAPAAAAPATRAVALRQPAKKVQPFTTVQPEPRVPSFRTVDPRLALRATAMPNPPIFGGVTIPAPVATEADSVKAVAAPANEAPAAVMTVGVGTVKFSGLLQAWYMGGTQDFTNTFRLRRTELKFVGEVSPSTKWTVMVDPSKTIALSNSYVTIGETQVVASGAAKPSSNMLQDAYITLNGGGIRFDAGQFKLPLGLEGGSQSSAKLETVERGLFMARGKLGGNRDLGVMVSGPLSSDMDFKIGLFNGTGEGHNTTDSNDQKAIVGRTVLHTALPGLQLGASGAWSGIAAGDGAPSDRVGGDLLYQRGPVMLKSEVMSGWDGETRGLGYYAHAGYQIIPALEAIVRYDVWDPNTAIEDAVKTVTERDYIAGITYSPAGANVKLQANYLHKTFDEFADSEDLLLLNLQTSW